MKTKQKLVLVTIGTLAVMSLFAYARLNGSLYRTDDHDVAAKEAVIEQVANFMRNEDSTIRPDKLRSVARMIYNEAADCNVDYRLILAIIKVESNFRHDAVSSKGARGLLQVKPSLARFIAKDMGMHWGGPNTLDEPDKNIKIGVRLFSGLIEDFSSINMALHAYHVGPTRLKTILSENRKPDRSFINSVLAEYKRNKTLLPEPHR